MSPALERMVWMPSPPLAPNWDPVDPVIDLDHLRRMTFGDRDLEREVLGMFAAQAAELAVKLGTLSAEASVLVHTLKGSARAIGASRVAAAAAELETAMRAGTATSEPLAALHQAIAETRGAIAAMTRKS